MLEYCAKLSDFHARFRAIGTNYNQVVKELRCHFSEKKAMALLYKLDTFVKHIILQTILYISLTCQSTLLTVEPSPY